MSTSLSIEKGTQFENKSQVATMFLKKSKTEKGIPVTAPDDLYYLNNQKLRNKYYELTVGEGLRSLLRFVIITISVFHSVKLVR